MFDYPKKLAQDAMEQISSAIAREKFKKAGDLADKSIKDMFNYKKNHAVLWLLSRGNFWEEKLFRLAAYGIMRRSLDEYRQSLSLLYSLKNHFDWAKIEPSFRNKNKQFNTFDTFLYYMPYWGEERYFADKTDLRTVKDVLDVMRVVYQQLNLALSVDDIKKLVDISALLPERATPKQTKRKGGSKSHKKTMDFNPSLLNTDQDLFLLTEQIIQSGTMQFSLCLYGAPGTGKSAYARYLAAQMGIDVIMKRGSDLFSKWVGESEQAISQAFREAEEQGAMLVFDEADSFLQNRQNMHESWQISQVNEMLIWMESTSIPFVCTTNLMSSLDKAALRRFIFKVKYDYLLPQQVELAFEQFFGEKPRVPLDYLTQIAPGDFAVVRKKATILKITDHQQLADMLLKEMHDKGL